MPVDRLPRERLPAGFASDGRVDRGEYIGDPPTERREAADRRLRIELGRARDEAGALKPEVDALRVAARLLEQAYPDVLPADALARHSELLRAVTRRERELARRLQDLWGES